MSDWAFFIHKILPVGCVRDAAPYGGGYKDTVGVGIPDGPGVIPFHSITGRVTDPPLHIIDGYSDTLYNG